MTNENSATLIIVDYNSPYLASCLDSIDLKYPVIVINNYIKKQIYLKRKNCIAINNTKNIGFGSACNQGFKIANSKYVIFCNPDIFFNRDTIRQLISFMRNNACANLATCALYDSDNIRQYNCWKFPSLFDLINRRLHISKKHETAFLMKHENRKQSMKVDWVSGALMIVRKNNFPGFDTRFFLYLEDIDLCRRIGGVFYCPFCKAVHVSQRGSARNTYLFMCHLRSMIYYFIKWTFLSKYL